MDYIWILKILFEFPSLSLFLRQRLVIDPGSEVYTISSAHTYHTLASWFSILESARTIPWNTQCLSPPLDKLFNISEDDSSMLLWLNTTVHLILYVPFTWSFIHLAHTELLLHASIVLGSGTDTKNKNK